MCFPTSLVIHVSTSHTCCEHYADHIIATVSQEFGNVHSHAIHAIIPAEAGLNISINVIPPTASCPFITLFTTGLSDQAMNVPKGQDQFQYSELIMHLPPGWPLPQEDALQPQEWFWPFEWLAKLAYYPHLHNTWLGGATAIMAPEEKPRRLAPNTTLSCFMLLADFAECSPIIINDDRVVKLYTVIPIHTDEREFERKHGVIALLQKLQEEGYTAVVNIGRPSVIDEPDVFELD